MTSKIPPMPIPIRVAYLPNAVAGAKLATAHLYDAGYDLHAAIPDGEVVILPPRGGSVVVPAGIAFDLPAGIVALVCPRSGLAAKNSVTVANAPGVIDSGYRGEVKVIMCNHHPYNEMTVKRGDRIAQVVFTHALRAEMVECSPGALSESSRGTDGLGSTGV